MIADRGMFGGGGGRGGANRSIVFDLSIRGGNMAALDAFGKRIADLQKQAASIQLGTTGGGVGTVAGGAAPGVAGTARATGGASSGNASTAASRGPARRPSSPSTVIVTSSDRYIREQDRFWDRAANSERRSPTSPRGGRGRGFRGGGVFADPSETFNRSQFSEGLEGVMQLARAFAYLGASSEENLEKAIRKLAKFEAAMMGVRGVLKVSEPLGHALGAGAGKLGMATGASAGWLGAAGLAAGIGAVGGGMAIADQLRFSGGGQPGGFSQGHADLFTRYTRWSMENGGFDPLAFTPAGAVFRATGYNDILRQRASGDIRGERMLMDRLGQQTFEQRLNAQGLNTARTDLAIAERQYRGVSMLQDSAMGFQSMPRGMQNRLLRRRNAYLDDPSSMNSRKAMSIYGLLGPESQEAFREDMRQRSQEKGLFDRGFGDLQNGRIPPIKYDEVLLKRELTLKLELQNDETIKGIEETVRQVLETANADLEKKAGDMTSRIQADVERLNAAFQNSQNTVGNLRGY